jgi:phosphatidylglycerophosphatase C
MATIAAFDFDGTMTDSDTLLPFIIHCTSVPRFALGIAQAFPRLLISYLTQTNYRQTCKECVLTQFFQHMPQKDLQKTAECFAATTLKSKIKPAALQRLRWHQSQGHTCVLISASLEIYLDPWARSVGFNRVLGSRLATDRDGRLTGKLEGLNCRGAEKTRRLQEAFGPKSNYTLYAYGDSSGDADLLALADFSFYRYYPKGNGV